MVALGAAVRAGVVPFAWSTTAAVLGAALGVVAVARLRDGLVDRAGLRELGWITAGSLAFTLAGRRIGGQIEHAQLALLELAQCSLSGAGDELAFERLRPLDLARSPGPLRPAAERRSP